MSFTIHDAIREIDEAQQRSMRLLLDGWQQEIEAQEKALLEQRKKRLEQAAEEAAIASSVASYLQGLVDQARSGDDVSQIPIDIRVASSSICAPSVSAINALISEAQTADDVVVDKAQQSASWAITHGYVPHPGDLADLLRTHGVDEPWAQRFAENATKLDQLDAVPFKNPQLQAHLGAARLEIVRDTVRLLDAYSPERSLRLIANPSSLLDLPGKVGAPGASVAGGNPKMGKGAFNRMLDNLF